MNCIVCKKHLDNFDNGEVNHPVDALVFAAFGNYGSRVFDPMDSSYLEVNICDDCIIKAREEKQVLIGSSVTTRNLEVWEK